MPTALCAILRRTPLPLRHAALLCALLPLTTRVTPVRVAAVEVATPARRAAPPAADRAALAAHCDELIASAVRSPFGWGWPAADPEADAPGPEANRPPRGKSKTPPAASHKPVLIDSAETAVLGLELYWAGQALAEPKYESAAFEAARGVASLQARTGQIRPQGTLGGGGVPRPETGDVPDRAPTRAALALLLTLIDADRPPADGPVGAAAREGAAGDGTEGRRWSERLKGPAGHAAHWLASQQAASGAWPSAYPPDAPFGKGSKVILLDSTDYRDNVCTLLLAGEVLNDDNLLRLADHAIDGLLTLRIPAWRSGARGLWTSASTLEGGPPRKFPELTRGYDLLATRYAMQAMLASYLVTLQPKGNDALADAARALAVLPKQEDKWVRYYSWRGELAASLPKPTPGGPFAPDKPAVDDGSASAFGLMPTLDALTQINAVGGKRYADFLAASRPLHARLAEQICGLSDDTLGLRLPRQPAGREQGAGPSDKAPDQAAANRPEEPPPAPPPDAPGLSDRSLKLWASLQKFMAGPNRP